MSNLNLIPKKRRLNGGLIAVALIIIMVSAASFFCLSSVSATPTMSSLAGTYSSTTGYTITLYENGTGLFSAHTGTWSIDNATTFEGTYSILSKPRTDYFTITNNGFTAVGTGNEYVKTTSASPNPSVPEFSSASIVLIVTILFVATCTLALVARKAKKGI
jgi:hypothetical protein